MLSPNTSAGAPAPAPRKISRRLHLTLLIALVGPALTFVALPAALPQLAADFGGGETGELLARRIQTFPFLGLAVGGLLAGASIGLMGYARLLIVAATAFCAAGALGLVTNTPALLLGGCVILGLGASLITCNLVAVAGHVLGEAQRPRMLGFQTAISDFSTVAGSICGGLLAQSFGWHGPFLLYTLYGATMLALALSLTSGSLPLPDRQSGGLWRAVLPAWPTYAAAVCVFMLVGTQTTQLPFFLATKGLASAPVRSLVLTCSTLAAMVGAVIYGLGQARLGARALRTAAMVLACGGFVGLTFWSGSLAVACALALAIGLAIGVTVPALFAATLEQAAPAVQVHAVGLLNSAIFLGSFLSPYVFTPIAARAGYPALFKCAALLALGLGGVGLAFSRSQARYRRLPT
jgi:MFS family permease